MILSVIITPSRIFWRMLGPKSKKNESMQIKLNENNSLFIDVETVEKTMVELYKFTPTGTYSTLVPSFGSQLS